MEYVTIPLTALYIVGVLAFFGFGIVLMFIGDSSKEKSAGLKGVLFCLVWFVLAIKFVLHLTLDTKEELDREKQVALEEQMKRARKELKRMNRKDQELWLEEFDNAVYESRRRR